MREASALFVDLDESGVPAGIEKEIAVFRCVTLSDIAETSRQCDIAAETEHVVTAYLQHDVVVATRIVNAVQSIGIDQMTYLRRLPSVDGEQIQPAVSELEFRDLFHSGQCY